MHISPTIFLPADEFWAEWKLRTSNVEVDVPEIHPHRTPPGWRLNPTGTTSTPSLLLHPSTNTPSPPKSRYPNQLDFNFSPCKPQAEGRWWGHGYACGLWTSCTLPSSNRGLRVQEEPTSQSFRCHFDPTT